MKNLDERVSKAVRHFWATRNRQARTQGRTTGRPDQGARSAVTGGAQMDGFIALAKELLLEAGLPEPTVFWKKKLQLPGYFRPEKKWDLLVVADDQLLASIEFKSQVGPSFGNNFNNRTEESLGNATDLWAAYREGAFRPSQRPWLGYLMLLEEAAGSLSPVGVHEPHFNVFPEFVDASYMRRYELFCRKLILERHYTFAAFITSRATTGADGEYSIPADDLSVERFAKTLIAHVSSFR